MIDCDYSIDDLTRVHWFQLFRGKKPSDMTDEAFEIFKRWAKAILTDKDWGEIYEFAWGHKRLTQWRRCLVNLFPTRTRIV